MALTMIIVDIVIVVINSVHAVRIPTPDDDALDRRAALAIIFIAFYFRTIIIVGPPG